MNDLTKPDQSAVSRDQRRQELEQLTFSQNGQLFQPKDGRQLMDMANMMSTAGFMVKDIYRGNPGACMGLIAICAPYGMNPLQVSWKSYKASKNDDAPICFEAQVVVAMVNASGAVQGGLRYHYEGAGDDRVCICSGLLVGETVPVEVRSPPLSKIHPKNSPLWKADPDQQLAYYTGRSWGRRYKPEMLLGVYDVDEMPAAPMRDVTPPAPEGPNLAQRLAAAKPDIGIPITPEDGQPVLDGEVMPDETLRENPATPAHWTDAAPETFFPGSDEFTQGVNAAKDGIPARECPFDQGTEQANDWLAGHHQFRRAMQ